MSHTSNEMKKVDELMLPDTSGRLGACIESFNYPLHLKKLY